jgi:hypothetical protein
MQVKRCLLLTYIIIGSTSAVALSMTNSIISPSSTEPATNPSNFSNTDIGGSTESKLHKRAAQENYVGTQPQIGRLTIFFGSEHNFCTGSVIQSRTRSMVVTAAHCLQHPSRSQPDSIIFAPQWHGELMSPVYFIASSWNKSPVFNDKAPGQHDVAFITFHVGPGHDNHELLEDYVGQARTPIFVPAGADLSYIAVTSLGNRNLSPAFSPNQPLRTCSADIETEWSSVYHAEILLLIGCDTTTAMSGGPVYQRNGELIGVISGHQIGAPNKPPAILLSALGPEEWELFARMGG